MLHILHDLQRLEGTIEGSLDVLTAITQMDGKVPCRSLCELLLPKEDGELTACITWPTIYSLPVVTAGTAVLCWE